VSTVRERAEAAGNAVVPPLLTAVADALDLDDDERAIVGQALADAYGGGVRYGIAEAVATLHEQGFVEVEEDRC